MEIYKISASPQRQTNEWCWNSSANYYSLLCNSIFNSKDQRGFFNTIEYSTKISNIKKKRNGRWKIGKETFLFHCPPRAFFFCLQPPCDTKRERESDPDNKFPLALTKVCVSFGSVFIFFLFYFFRMALVL